MAVSALDGALKQRGGVNAVLACEALEMFFPSQRSEGANQAKETSHHRQPASLWGIHRPLTYAGLATYDWPKTRAQARGRADRSYNTPYPLS